MDDKILPHPKMTYSQITRVGDVLFVAGQPGIDYATGIVPTDFEGQARQSLRNIQLVLRSVGADLRDVVKTTVFLRNGEDFAKLNELYAEYFPVNPPARS